MNQNPLSEIVRYFEENGTTVQINDGMIAEMQKGEQDGTTSVSVLQRMA